MLLYYPPWDSTGICCNNIVVPVNMESTLCWTCTKTYYQTSFVVKEFLTGQWTLEVRSYYEVILLAGN